MPKSIDLYCSLRGRATISEREFLLYSIIVVTTSIHFNLIQYVELLPNNYLKYRHFENVCPILLVKTNLSKVLQNATCISSSNKSCLEFVF